MMSKSTGPMCERVGLAPTRNSRTQQTDPAVTAAYESLIAVGEELKKALERRENCKDSCFADPKKLARCWKCRDDLGTAAARYAEATGRFRGAVEDAVPSTKS